MKVLLLQDVKSQGKKGDVIEVNDGYGRNYIIHKKLGIEATPAVVNEWKQKKAAEEKRKQAEKEEAAVFAKELEKITVTVKMKAAESGKIYGSVGSKEIGDALTQMGVELDRRKISLKEPIKDLGDYEVEVKVYPSITAKLKVHIMVQ